MTKAKSASKATTKSATKGASLADQAANGPTVKAADVSAIGSATAAKAVAVIGAKQHIRNLLSVDGASLTLEQLCATSGKSAVNVRTMLSDLRSPTYAGKAGVFNTVGVKKADGKTYYEQVKPAVAK